ncbi:molybdate ABC transporter substrate-binding protein [Cohaesibacter celericrescens]|uniref:Molybdate ABC transporter substrate-binding protein n=2 Tax=Cohaesibacter celericrescens TaxID=2067669 RepID=A0A2N5XLI6_9HYPH|nr:molybdate ABC transporter substrate-binding protein [Cohaesibacter celericrescens]PLW75290.1 molybdate ABC transporter substrate-binding protein [Cohaesibacter celericrescens]
MPQLFTLLILLMAPLYTQSAKAEPITLFAAASLTGVVNEATNLFEKETGIKVRLVFASSSTLARQIEAGASADLYFSANIKWMDYLVKAALIKPETLIKTLSNTLVLISPKYLSLDSLATIDTQTLNDILGDSGLLSMGDPDHVPVGIYGKKALKQRGLWEPLHRRIARADNALAALTLVSRGETPLGIVYQTDAIHQPNVDILFGFEPEETQIEYALALTQQTSSDDAKKLLNFLSSARGLALFEKYGFTILKDYQRSQPN